MHLTPALFHVPTGPPTERVPASLAKYQLVSLRRMCTEMKYLPRTSAVVAPLGASSTPIPRTTTPKRQPRSPRTSAMS
ncbi:hypothetical protein AWENTII_005986 [Aspergillus wentii]